MKMDDETRKKIYEYVKSQPNFEQYAFIYTRALGYWLVEGDPDQRQKAERVLSQYSTTEEDWMLYSLLTYEQAAAQDQGDQHTSDTKSFAGNKAYGDQTARERRGTYYQYA
jgi:hypothetical protein